MEWNVTKIDIKWVPIIAFVFFWAGLIVGVTIMGLPNNRNNHVNEIKQVKKDTVFNDSIIPIVPLTKQP